MNRAGFVELFWLKRIAFDASQLTLNLVSLNRARPGRLAVVEPRRLVPETQRSLIARITVPEIARRLNIGRQAVYRMLEERIIPGVRIGRLWTITRHAYEQWERTCGTHAPLDLLRKPEVTVN